MKQNCFCERVRNSSKKIQIKSFFKKSRKTITTHKMPNEEYDHLLKLLLVGDTAVGKSSLLLRFTDGELYLNAEMIATRDD